MTCLPRMLPSPSPNVTNLNSNSNPYSALFYAIVLNPVRSPLRCHTTQLSTPYPSNDSFLN